MASGLPLAALLLVSCIYFAESGRRDREASLRGIQFFCIRGWQRFDSGCYKFYPEAKSWVEAKDLCISDGANLASIHSQRQTDFLRELSGYTRTWVGGFQSDHRWMWTDRSGFDYTQWAPGEPNGRKTDNCMEINFQGADWDDTGCHRQSGFICAKMLSN